MIIGVFGGSFDPIHLGHLWIADTFTKACKLDRLIVMPSCSHNLKTTRIASSEQIIDMLQLVFADRAIIDDREIQRGISSTYNSLVQLRKKYGSSVCLIFAMGEDVLNQMDQWDSWTDILPLANLVVFKRQKKTLLSQTVAEYLSDKWVSIENISSVNYGKISYCVEDTMHISSTAIRAGDSVQVPEVIKHYINEHGIYG